MITTLYIAWLFVAVAKPLSNNDLMFSPFDILDDTNPGNIDLFQDSLWLQLETDEPFFDPSFNQPVEEVDFLGTTYAPDDCSAFHSQQIGKRIRVRDIPPMCTIEPENSSETQSSGDDNEDLHYKDNDGLQTEPRNSVGLNRYRTNSDGTICPPDMWLLCSSIQPDLESHCLGCYPRKFWSCFYWTDIEKIVGSDWASRSLLALFRRSSL